MRLIDSVDLLRMRVKWHKEELRNNVSPSESKTKLLEDMVVLNSTVTLLNENLTVSNQSVIGKILQQIEREIRTFSK